MYSKNKAASPTATYLQRLVGESQDVLARTRPHADRAAEKARQQDAVATAASQLYEQIKESTRRQLQRDLGAAYTAQKLNSATNFARSCKSMLDAFIARGNSITKLDRSTVTKRELLSVRQRRAIEDKRRYELTAAKLVEELGFKGKELTGLTAEDLLAAVMKKQRDITSIVLSKEE